MLSRRIFLSGLTTFCLPWPVLAQTQLPAPASLDDGWQVAAPDEAGLDPDALAALVEEIQSAEALPNVHAVLIEHKGRLVFEQYFAGNDQNWGQPLGRVDHAVATQHDLRSVTKSVTSLLLGIALGRKAEKALARPIASFFPGWKGANKELDAVTLHHVLTMTAGLDWNEM